jgi:hypothetical protein
VHRRGNQRRSPAWIAHSLAIILTLAACSSGQTAPATGSTTGSVLTASSTANQPATAGSGTPSAAASGNPAAVSSAPPPASLDAPTEPAPTELASAPSAADVPSTTTVPTTEGQSEAPSPASGYQSTVSEIGPETAARMGRSWHAGCPVPLSDLRYLTVTYRGFDGADHTGELVVAASVASAVTDIFGRLYAAEYPIASLRLVDDFGGSDDDSMAADNSSAFNCRPVTGGGGFSEHSYGTAIDLNPVENPYLSGSLVLPPAGRRFVDRPEEPGVIQPGDAVVEAFGSHGWTWGGTWSGPIDYQHFSVSGR